MTKTKTLKSDNPEQSKRFIEMAREVGADETGEALERAMKKVRSAKRPAASPKNSS